MAKKNYLPESFVERWNRENRDGTYPDLRFRESDIIRLYPDRTNDTSLMDPFVQDFQKIQWCPYYNRYAGKTQVFALYRNDDITRRDIHVQHVAQISKIIGRRLHLNEDLIEAIAIAHDLGHTPFGHTGESFLNKIYFERTGRHFNHNIQSVRILTELFPNNISMQVLDGVAGHNGEEPVRSIAPVKRDSYDQFLAEIEECYTDPENHKARRFCASTLEGLVVRYSDVIAYLISDRLDAANLNIRAQEISASRKDNSRIISMLESDIILNSYGKREIGMSEEGLDFLVSNMNTNYKYIYHSHEANGKLNGVKEMMEQMYERLLCDLCEGDETSPVFKHHIRYIQQFHDSKSVVRTPYREAEKNQIIVDYIASMTDEYFVDLYDYLFPGKRDPAFRFTGYFDDL